VLVHAPVSYIFFVLSLGIPEASNNRSSTVVEGR
jgi:hypothetical protein